MGVDRHNLNTLSDAIDAWYRAHARDLPWRVRPQAREAGIASDPYKVWLSEVMLQQTTGPHAAPYYAKFTERWPEAQALAGASWEDVSAAWAGLGYYSRARNLHAAAQVMAEQGLPDSAEGWRALPGVGPYTAAAVASIALGERIAPVDGNIERVLSRVFAIGSDRTEAGWRAAKKEIARTAQALVEASAHHPGDLAQALMDLGATICTPTRPACALCPLFAACAARMAGEPERYPEKPAKREKPVRLGVAFVATHKGRVLLERRPSKGLLGGMLMPPSTPWTDHAPEPLLHSPLALEWRSVGEVRHVFTHFALKLEVWTAEAPHATGDGWIAIPDALAAAPTVGRKALMLAIES